jgi:methionyl-tRNA synthetase
VEKEEVKKEEAKKEEAKRGEAKEGEAKEGEAKKEEISFEDFQSMDIRIGEIKSAEAIKGSNKLLKLKVDIGGEVRQVVAGIAQSYSMDDLVGTQVVVLVNLQPAKLFGIESQAMLLAADVAGRAVLLRPREAVETGTKVR